MPERVIDRLLEVVGKDMPKYGASVFTHRTVYAQKYYEIYLKGVPSRLDDAIDYLSEMASYYNFDVVRVNKLDTVAKVILKPRRIQGEVEIVW